LFGSEFRQHFVDIHLSQDIYSEGSMGRMGHAQTQFGKVAIITPKDKRMAALLLLIVAGGLGYGLGWLAKSAGRRVIEIDLPDGKEENKSDTVPDDDAATERKGK
jgi:hypothetical protein